MNDFFYKSRVRYRTPQARNHLTARKFPREQNETFLDNATLQDLKFFDKEFVQECLRSHNHYRTQHGCSPLHLSTELSKISQQWADQISKEDHLHHSHHPCYGENIYVSYVSDNSLLTPKGSEVVESWYSEQKYYPFNGCVTRETVCKTGHFTQVVWRNSRELGIGKAVSKGHRFYVVANYYPAGNIMNKFSTNVSKPILRLGESHFYRSRLFTKSTRIYFDSWT